MLKGIFQKVGHRSSVRLNLKSKPGVFKKSINGKNLLKTKFAGVYFSSNPFLVLVIYKIANCRRGQMIFPQNSKGLSWSLPIILAHSWITNPVFDADTSLYLLKYSTWKMNLYASLKSNNWRLLKINQWRTIKKVIFIQTNKTKIVINNLSNGEFYLPFYIREKEKMEKCAAITLRR